MIVQGKGKLSITREGKHVLGVVQCKNIMVKIDISDLVIAMAEASYDKPPKIMVEEREPPSTAEDLPGESFAVLDLPCEVTVDRR